MGIFDFFRKKEDVRIEKIREDEIKEFIEKRKIETENEKKELSDKIKILAEKLIEELKNEKTALENIKLEEKKVEEKLKIIAKENLENYISYLDKLIKKIENIDEAPEDMLDKINSSIQDFKRKSAMTFEKATILVGKEMEDVKNSINGFIREVKIYLDENEKLPNISRSISFAAKEVEKISIIEKSENAALESIKEIEKETAKKEEMMKNIGRNIEEIKSTKEYGARMKKNEEMNERKEKLIGDIGKLREIIDFRALASIYHGDEKKMIHIKECRDNFIEEFNKDNCEKIIKILDDANINHKELDKRMEQIANERKEIEGIKMEKEEVKNLEREIEIINSDIDGLKLKKINENKKIEKFKERKKEINNLIKEELMKINIYII